MSSQKNQAKWWSGRSYLPVLLLTQSLFWISHAHAADKEGAREEEGKRREVAASLGVTRNGTPIQVIFSQDSLNIHTGKTKVLLIGGLDGSFSSTLGIINAVQWFEESEEAKPFRDKISLTVIPNAYPDRNLDTSKETDALSFPPQDGFYNSQTHPEAAYLWRWIGMHAPDLVLDVRVGKKLKWKVPSTEDKQLKALAKHLNAETLEKKTELVSALATEKPSETGLVPALQVELTAFKGISSSPQPPEENCFKLLLPAMDEVSFTGPSPARAELQARLKRTPLEVLKELATIYGQDLKDVQYIPSLALIARLRLGELTDDPAQLEAVEEIVHPYYEGAKSPATKNGSQLAGHLIFTELAAVSVNEKAKARYLELAKGAADLAFDPSGELRPSMPHHSEMSDALFMGGPILAQVGELTGEERYFEACFRHLQFMRELVLRKDNLYRHSPLDEAAWGRGNGFPALGMTLCIASFPEDHPDRPKLIKALQDHLQALLKHQDQSGAWHQVIDHPESYQELTCTCMIGYSLARGVREGWLDKETYWPAAEKAWEAANTRIGNKGRLVDVCTGTGKQRSLRDYYDRPAILGTDARGGAMSMIFAAEMAQHKEYQSNE